MIKRCSLIIVCAFTLLPQTSIAAQECLLMHVIDNPPAGYRTENGELAGIHSDFLTALEENSNLCVKKKLIPYSRARKSLELGFHDGGIVARSPDLDPYVHYIAKLITLKTIVLPGKGVMLNSYDDLAGLFIGRVRGSRLDDHFDTDDNLVLIDLPSYEHALKMLKRGRIDAVAGSGLGLSISEQLGMQDVVNVPGRLILSQRELWLVISNHSEHADQIQSLRDAAQTLIWGGVFEDILQDYYGDGWELYNQ